MVDAAQAEPAGIVGVFDRAAAAYDRTGPRFFAHFGERLVAQARLAPGQRVLDIATGRGALLFPAARYVGPGGHVTGIDLAPDMVRRTAAEVLDEGLTNATVARMDAERLDFADASFDIVLCGFAVWFFPRPWKALQECFRVLRPDGRIALSTWSEESPFVGWLNRELAAALPPQGPPQPPDAPRFDTRAGLEAALDTAGFTELQVRDETADFVYADDEAWWASLWTHGVRGRLEALDPRALADVKSDLLRRAAPLRQADGIHTPFTALFALGRRPAP